MTTTATKTVKGVLGKKLGMTQVWDADNRLVPVTVDQGRPLRRDAGAQRRRTTATTPSRSPSVRSTRARSTSR